MSLKISLITIVYNNRECIKDAIESVDNQTYSNIEHVVIDGGSSDGTQDVIEQYKSNLGYYISEKDSGLYNALNKGIKKCTGDVIGILHSDDLLYNNRTVERIAEQFGTKDIDLLYANGQYVARKDIDIVKRVYRAKQFKSRFLYYGWVPLHTTMYVKKEVFKTVGMYDESYAIASDYDFTLKLLKNPKIKKEFLDEWVVKMRLGGKSTTASLQKKKSLEDYQIIKKNNLFGTFTLSSKIIRKIRQYALPKVIKY